jgi:hypothetical protein
MDEGTPKEKKEPRQSGATLADIAKACGKPVTVLRNIQKNLGLHVPSDGGYSEAYARFLGKIVALQALHVSRQAIEALFENEVQILRLFHVDSLTQSPTWYLDACGLPEFRSSRHTRLFLSGYDLGFRCDGSVAQDTFDFNVREKELFNGKDMGEDVRHLLAEYVRQLAAIRATVRAEIPSLRSALTWGAKAFDPEASERRTASVSRVGSLRSDS